MIKESAKLHLVKRIRRYMDTVSGARLKRTRARGSKYRAYLDRKAKELNGGSYWRSRRADDAYESAADAYMRALGASRKTLAAGLGIGASLAGGYGLAKLIARGAKKTMPLTSKQKLVALLKKHKRALAAGGAGAGGLAALVAGKKKTGSAAIGGAVGVGVGGLLGQTGGRAFGKTLKKVFVPRHTRLRQAVVRKLTPRRRRAPTFDDLTAEAGLILGMYGGGVTGARLGGRFASRGAARSATASGARAHLQTIGVRQKNIKSKDDLKKAYRAAMRKHHPDRVGPDAPSSVRDAATERSKDINTAYSAVKKTRWFDKLAHLMLTKHASKKKLTEKLMEALRSKSLTEKQKMELHRFLMPAVAGTAMWGLTGAALAPKGRRKAAFASGLALGAVRPMLWKAIGKGYAKAVRRPFGELIK